MKTEHWNSICSYFTNISSTAWTNTSTTLKKVQPEEKILDKVHSI